MQWLTEVKDWIVNVGKRHHVDPLIFSILYVIGKTTFLIFAGWTVKNLRNQKPFLIILLIGLAGYILPSVYLVIAGRHIPFWVYTLIGIVLLYGAFVAWKKVRVTSAK